MTRYAITSSALDDMPGVSTRTIPDLDKHGILVRAVPQRDFRR